MKNVTLFKRIFLTLVVIVGTLSIGYLAIAFIAFAGMLDNGGTGDILEWMKNPYFSAVLFGTVIWMVFLKKTRKRLENIFRP